MIDAPLVEDDIIMNAKNGKSERRLQVRARENPITLEELHEKLVAYKGSVYLKKRIGWLCIHSNSQLH